MNNINTFPKRIIVAYSFARGSGSKTYTFYGPAHIDTIYTDLANDLATNFPGINVGQISISNIIVLPDWILT